MVAVPAIVQEAEDDPDVDDRLVHQGAVSDDDDGVGLA